MGRVIEGVRGGLIDGDGAGLGCRVWRLACVELQRLEFLDVGVLRHSEGCSTVSQVGSVVAHDLSQYCLCLSRRVAALAGRGLFLYSNNVDAEGMLRQYQEKIRNGG